MSTLGGGNLFWENRTLAFADNTLFWLFSLAVLAVFARWGSRPFLPLLSLRTRITLVLLSVTGMALGSIAWGLNPLIALAVWAIILLVGIQAILANLSRVGLMNAFATTRAGLTPEGSLKLVHSELAFLGIGGGKLTVSAEFAKALRRCADAGGQVRFLLSDPENPSLERLAKQNLRDDASYRGRVRESIREIIHKGGLAGVPCEVRIYRLENKLELPHFRLMFIDNSMCLFSHLVWNDAEGWDNPQLVLRKDTKKKPNSLYLGYQTYFEDLWNSTSVEAVTPEMLAAWPS